MHVVKSNVERFPLNLEEVLTIGRHGEGNWFVGSNGSHNVVIQKEDLDGKIERMLLCIETCEVVTEDTSLSFRKIQVDRVVLE